LLTSALRYNDAATGCLVDEGDLPVRHANNPAAMASDRNRKGLLAQSETSEPGARDQAEQALVRFYRYYRRHPVPGGWFDQFDVTGISLVDSIRASSLYHVLCAISEADAVFE
jgi:N-acylglucosamine 2-epimerase (GlcNAc 2-epimerase)